MPFCIVDYVVAETGLDKSKVETMIEYITYNPQKKNVDIMYQPIVQIEKVIAEHVVLSKIAKSMSGRSSLRCLCFTMSSINIFPL